MATFSETGPKIGRQDIAEIEQQFGITFPDSYVAYLLAHNGGRVSPSIFKISGSQRGDRGVVNVLCSVALGRIGNLASTIRRHIGRMPSVIVPIGNDPGGDLICIGVSGEHRDAIYFWDRTAEVDDGSNHWGNVHKLADSLQGFFDSLT